MAIPRIYHPEIIASQMTVHLEPQASKHLISVLRLKVGATLILFNGQGGCYNGRLSAINKIGGKLQALIEVQEYMNLEVESPLNIHLGQAILLADKMNYVIQKSVELGVSQITLLMTERTEMKLNEERLQSKMLHWQQIIKSACAQCGRNRIPNLHAVAHFNDWVKQAEKTEDLKFILAPKAENKLSGADAVCKNVSILVGAEGGFSHQEIQMAERHQFIPLQLGPRILRTETAALAMIAAMQTRWGDF